MTLREVVHAHIPFLHAGSTVRDAIDKMDIYQFPALVIVDEEKHVLSVITEGDLSRAVQKEGLLKISSEPAIHFSSKDPICGSPSMEIGDALHLMLNSGLTILPVVEDSSLTGIVLRIDLMQAMLADFAS